MLGLPRCVPGHPGLIDRVQSSRVSAFIDRDAQATSSEGGKIRLLIKLLLRFRHYHRLSSSLSPSWGPSLMTPPASLSASLSLVLVGLVRGSFGDESLEIVPRHPVALRHLTRAYGLATPPRSSGRARRNSARDGFTFSLRRNSPAKHKNGVSAGSGAFGGNAASFSLSFPSASS
jgi:hypothetical protein